MQTRSDILVSIQQTKKLYEKFCDPVSLRYGLTKQEIDVLLFLSNNPQFCTAKDIVRYRFLTKSHVSKSVENLIQKGLLIRKQDETDKRRLNLKLSESAEQVVREARQMQGDFLNLLYHGFTAEEMAMFNHFLERLSTNVKHAFEITDRRVE